MGFRPALCDEEAYRLFRPWFIRNAVAVSGNCTALKTNKRLNRNNDGELPAVLLISSIRPLTVTIPESALHFALLLLSTWKKMFPFVCGTSETVHFTWRNMSLTDIRKYVVLARHGDTCVVSGGCGMLERTSKLKLIRNVIENPFLCIRMIKREPQLWRWK